MFAPTDTAQQEDICRNIAQVGEIYWKLVLLLVVMLVVVLLLLLLLMLLFFVVVGAGGGGVTIPATAMD